MAKTSNIKKLLKYLTPDPMSADFSEFDKQVSVLKEQLREKVTIKTLDEVTQELKRFKKSLNMKPLVDSIDKLKSSLDKRGQELFDEIEKRTLELSMADKARVESLKVEILELQVQLSSLEEVRKKDLEAIYASIPNLSQFEDMVNEMILEVSSRLDTLEDEEREDWQKKIDELRKELINRLSNIGGGAQNQQVNVNSSVMSLRYADINFVNSGGVTWSASDDSVNKRVNIVASVIASGSGGGGGSPSVGGAVIGGVDGGVLFVHPASVLAQDAANFFWDDTNNRLGIGTSTPATILDIVGSTTGQLYTNIKNTESTGQAGFFGENNAGRNVNFLAYGSAYAFNIMGISGANATSFGAGGSASALFIGHSAASGPIHIGYFNQVAPVITVTTTQRVGIRTTNPSKQFQIGTPGSVVGTFAMAGSTAGLVTIQPASVAGDWTLTLPTDDGTNGQVLTTDGNGITSWTTPGASSVASGITRVTSVLSVSSTLAAISMTDYAFFPNVGLALTMPTAIGNSNLYTVKNMSTSSVLVIASEGIDGSASALLPVQNQSLDIISNGSVWCVI